MLKQFKRNRFLRSIYFVFIGLKEFFNFNPILLVKQYLWFFNQLRTFNKLKINQSQTTIELYPQLFDNLTFTPIEPIYFYQDSWAAKKIFELKPTHHYDIGSSAKTIGILSQFVPVTMIDIRPLEVELENLHFKKGSILELPFEDNSIESLSSLCVVEHIGLGRYGDAIDPLGSEKAVKELKRVLKADGIILFSVPVDTENKIFFNAHRAFTREYILELFNGFYLMEEKYIYGTKMYDNYDKDKGFGTGLYMFKKEQ